jgi:hypothetical protein
LTTNIGNQLPCEAWSDVELLSKVKTVIWGGVQELAKLTDNLPIVLLFLSDAILDPPHVLLKEKE